MQDAEVLYENSELVFKKTSLKKIPGAVSIYRHIIHSNPDIKPTQLCIPLDMEQPATVFITVDNNAKITGFHFKSEKKLGLITRHRLKNTLKKIMARLDTPLTPLYLISTAQPAKIIFTPRLRELFTYSLKELARDQNILTQLHEKFTLEKIERIRAKKRDNTYNGITRNDGTRLRKISSKKMMADLTRYLEKNKPYFFQFSKRRHHKILSAYLKTTLLQNWGTKKIATFNRSNIFDAKFPYDIKSIRTFTKNLDRAAKNKYNAFFRHTSKIQEHLIIDASAVTQNISKEHAEALAAIMMGYKIDKKNRPDIPGRIV